MSEFIGNFLEKIYGEGGWAEKIFRFLLLIGVGYLGINLLIKDVSSEIQSSAPLNQISPTAKVIKTDRPILLSTPPSVSNQLNKLSCVTINGKNPTAFAAWKKLGQPEKVIFIDRQPTGPVRKKIKDKEGNGIIDNLPDLVHRGDKLCAYVKKEE